jgi:ADP-heptose:LPS heptosyltransferase|tara:strand:+ start:800 stop:1039 length:240 start_codon:yes stop_codon:yes gene_type:complete
MEQLRWVIITSENAEEVFAKLQEQGKDPVLFGLSDEDYQILAKNFAQVRAYMIEQRLTLDQYRKYYENDIDTNTNTTDE